MTEVMSGVLFVGGLATLRFGAPILVMWLVKRLDY